MGLSLSPFPGVSPHLFVSPTAPYGACEKSCPAGRVRAVSVLGPSESPALCPEEERGLSCPFPVAFPPVSYCHQVFRIIPLGPYSTWGLNLERKLKDSHGALLRTTAPLTTEAFFKKIGSTLSCLPESSFIYF